MNPDPLDVAASGEMPAPAVVAINPIQLENQRPGSGDYQVQKPASNHEIEGYASVTSAGRGEPVDFFVNASRPAQASWQLFRIGYYGGLGGRLIDAGGTVDVGPQSSCGVSDETGLVACAWASSLQLKVSERWVTGYYLLKLTRDDGFETRIPFVVREPHPRAPLLVQSSVNTWQAYNLWGGSSLYRNQLGNQSAFVGTHANQVSFDRPYADEDGAGLLFAQEAHMYSWLEQQGYDAAYVTNLDIDRDASLLDGRKLFLSVGHDEYYSVPERDALDAAKRSGVSLGFFSANSAYWRIRFDGSPSGAERRIITCYKSGRTDPVKRSPETTNKFRDGPDSRPEDRLTGVMYEIGDRSELDFPLSVAMPQHWLFAGTGVRQNELLSNLLGPEWDQAIADDQRTPGIEYPIRSLGIGVDGGLASGAASVYYPSASSFVFAAGTIDWSLGLGGTGQHDARVQRVTQNLLARAGLPPRDWTVPDAAPSRDAGQLSASLIAGSGTAGHVDGPAKKAQFDGPSGLAGAPDGTLYVTEAHGNSIRKIAPNGDVTTLTACLRSGHIETGAHSPCLRGPTGIALDQDGTLYVSDTANGRICKVAPDGSFQPLVTSLDKPRGIAVGSAGELYFVEPHLGTVTRVVDGVATVIAQQLDDPTAVATGPHGEVYVSTGEAGAIYRVLPKLEALTPPAHASYDRIEVTSETRLRPLEGMVLDGDRLVFSDTGNHRVRALALADKPELSTLLESSGYGAALGPAGVAQIVLPRGIAPYHDGYAIVDGGNQRIVYLGPPLEGPHRAAARPRSLRPASN